MFRNDEAKEKGLGHVFNAGMGLISATCAIIQLISSARGIYYYYVRFLDNIDFSMYTSGHENPGYQEISF
jgi:hypothetical protein